MKLEVWYEIAALTETYGTPTVDGNFFVFKSGRQSASLEIYDTGELRTRQYRLDGLPHRPEAEGPAWESFYKNGQPGSRKYSQHGYCNRSGDRPAWESFHEDGRLKTSEIWRDGSMVKRIL